MGNSDGEKIRNSPPSLPKKMRPGEGEDSDESFIGGPDPYLGSEDEGHNFIRLEEEVQKLFHCELNIHQDAEVVEGAEEYDITDFSTLREVYNEKVEKRYHSSPPEEILSWGYPTMTDEFKRYNGLKKWFDRDGTVVPDIDGDDSDDDNLTYIRNPREVRPRERPPTNRHKGGRENIFRRGSERGYSARTGPNANGENASRGDNNGGTSIRRRAQRSARTVPNANKNNIDGGDNNGGRSLTRRA
ncbi:hypothetical protein RND71_008340 [Anisodus tanguticus]|uniref:Uncharacterized protein n=1 Tax=Anisodus tanguticus TaxID=243964 RepID=A0AAE1VQJ8_9SOLA|nr:hypothetical protein RND71_008340 [Anisodus tanguticus]